MSIVSKKGDGGFTDLSGAEKSSHRVRKDDPLIECLGTLDELEAFCALAEITIKSCGDSRNGNIIAELRKELSGAVMSVTAWFLPVDTPSGFNIIRLEQQIAELEKENPLHDFVRNWSKPAAVYLNVARSICRRAERRMVSAFENVSDTADTTASALLVWINRLSDLLFLLAVSEERR